MVYIDNMERYNLGELTKKIYQSGLVLFELKTLKDILEVEKESTLFQIIQRLITINVLEKIEKGKYVLKGAKINDFALANFIYQPSYISFESALNFYGILSQFPYEVSSATSKKTITKNFEGKAFSYFHFKKELLFGYEKKDDFLIALPEKAVLDQIYFWAKGLKTIDFSEWDLRIFKKNRLRSFLKKYPQTKQTKKISKILKKYNLL